MRSPRETVARSLEGDYRSEHLFALRQSLVGYRFYQTLISEVDEDLEVKMRELPRAATGPEQMPPRTKEPAFDLKAELFRIAGVDLTDVPGISTITAHTILMEVGPDVSRFRNASAFASWKFAEDAIKVERVLGKSWIAGTKPLGSLRTTTVNKCATPSKTAHRCAALLPPLRNGAGIQHFIAHGRGMGAQRVPMPFFRCAVPVKKM